MLKIKDFPLNSDKLSFSKLYSYTILDENSTFQYFYYSNKQDDFITYDNPVLIMAGGFGRGSNLTRIFVKTNGDNK